MPQPCFEKGVNVVSINSTLNAMTFWFVWIESGNNFKILMYDVVMGAACKMRL